MRSPFNSICNALGFSEIPVLSMVDMFQMDRDFCDQVATGDVVETFISTTELARKLDNYLKSNPTAKEVPSTIVKPRSTLYRSVSLAVALSFPAALVDIMRGEKEQYGICLSVVSRVGGKDTFTHFIGKVPENLGLQLTAD